MKVIEKLSGKRLVIDNVNFINHIDLQAPDSPSYKDIERKSVIDYPNYKFYSKRGSLAKSQSPENDKTRNLNNSFTNVIQTYKFKNSSEYMKKILN